MYCKYCGKEINDDADVCVHCGRNTDRHNQEYVNTQKSYDIDESKTAIGVLLGLFLGLIGLVIGLLLYPSGTLRRETFIRGWVGAFICYIIVGIILYVAVVGCTTVSYIY